VQFERLLALKIMENDQAFQNVAQFEKALVV